MSGSEAFKVGDWLVEPQLDRISRGSERVNLRPRVMDFLVYLANQDGRVVSTDDIIDDLWPGQAIGQGTVYNCVTELRQALGDDADGQPYIENIPRRGYRLRVAVTASEDESIRGWPARSKRVIWATGAVALLVGVWLITYRPAPDAPPVEPQESIQSIAVLPFVNLSGSADDEYFSDGLTETLLNALAQLRDLKVIARTSSFYFKGQGIDVRDIAGTLGVGKLLEGTVQRDGDKVRIVAQLVDGDTGFQIWSKTYEEEMTDIFAVQDDIANSVALTMAVTLANEAGLSGGGIETVGTNNINAYDKYLQGLQQKNNENNTSALLAEILFRAALALDPDFYEARLELARAIRSLEFLGEITDAEASERLGPLVDRLVIDRPDDGLALSLFGYLQFYRSQTEPDVSVNIEEHIAAMTAAIERTPNIPELYVSMFRLVRFGQRRPEESIEWLDRGIAVDPLSSELHANRGRHLVEMGDIERGEASIARSLALNPDQPTLLAYAAVIAAARGDEGQAFELRRKAMKAAPLDWEFPSMIAMDMYTCGLMDEGDKYLERAMAVGPDKPRTRATQLIQILFRGDHTEARDKSETMLREDIENRRDAYWVAAMVYMSTMSSLERTDEALSVLDELRPGISSPDFHARNMKDFALQYFRILALAQSQPMDETLAMLDAIVPRWDESLPDWRNPGVVALIEMARGQTEKAVELTLEYLERGYDWSYRHITYDKAMALQPAVAERLAELEEELEQECAERWEYIEKNDRQLK